MRMTNTVIILIAQMCSASWQPFISSKLYTYRIWENESFQHARKALKECCKNYLRHRPSKQLIFEILFVVMLAGCMSHPQCSKEYNLK